MAYLDFWKNPVFPEKSVLSGKTGVFPEKNNKTKQDTKSKKNKTKNKNTESRKHEKWDKRMKTMKEGMKAMDEHT